MIYLFESFALDTDRYELRNGNRLCQVKSRGLDVLIYLIEHRGTIVSREELLENLWPGQYIGEAALNNCIMEARRAIGDNGQTQRLIKTIHGRGYLFIASIETCSFPPPVSEGPAFPDVPVAVAPGAFGLAASVSDLVVMPDPSGLFQDVLAGDYTLVTVVCVTLDNVDELSQDLSVEVMQSIRQTFFAHAQEEVQRYGGTFSFFGADGMLLLFGLPVPLNDHALRAVSAAFHLKQCLHDYCTALSTQQPVNLMVRIGLHTGPMEMTDVCDNPWLSSFDQSETANLAIWLQCLAKTGTVMTSRVTIPFVQSAVHYIEHEEVRIPGNTDPIMTYTICSLTPQ